MSKKVKRNKAHYSISAVAQMFAIHQQTIRLYEKEGLIAPKRSEGNTRLFSEDDINRLEEIIYLTHQLGINIAGVQMILKLQKQVQKMQRDMNKLFDETKTQLDEHATQSKRTIESSARALARLKKSTPNQSETTGESDSWDIEYEE
jgi:MerR family transcriptional regulator/heat shock protein HspR